MILTLKLSYFSPSRSLIFCESVSSKHAMDLKFEPLAWLQILKTVSVMNQTFAASK
jgi:hypothetical protein